MLEGDGEWYDFLRARDLLVTVLNCRLGNSTSKVSTCGTSTIQYFNRQLLLESDRIWYDFLRVWDLLVTVLNGGLGNL